MKSGVLRVHVIGCGFRRMIGAERFVIDAQMEPARIAGLRPDPECSKPSSEVVDHIGCLKHYCRRLWVRGIMGFERPKMQMPRYWTGEQIEPGDWVRVYSSRFGVWHHGIVCSLVVVPGGIGVEIVHNTKGGGVDVADWYEFADGSPVFLHRRPESIEQRAEIMARANSNIGKPYALFAQNCEHFASFAFTGQAESVTLKAVGWVAAGVVAVAVLASES